MVVGKGGLRCGLDSLKIKRTLIGWNVVQQWRLKHSELSAGRRDGPVGWWQRECEHVLICSETVHRCTVSVDVDDGVCMYVSYKTWHGLTKVFWPRCRWNARLRRWPAAFSACERWIKRSAINVHSRARLICFNWCSAPQYTEQEAASLERGQRADLTSFCNCVIYTVLISIIIIGRIKLLIINVN